MSESSPISQTETNAVDLTSAKYWDRQWGGSSQNEPAPLSLRSIVKSLVGERFSPLYDFLHSQLAELAQRRAGIRLRVLEVGCAPGTILDGLMQRSPQHDFSGVDFSLDGIKDTLARFDLRECRPEVHHADVREFHPDQRYDYVYSCGLIEHFTDPLSTLRDHVRLCKPGGKVVITVPNYSGSLQRFCMERLDPEGWRSHNTAVMSEEALRELATGAGLKNITTGGIGKHMLRTVCEVKSPINTTIQAAARVYSMGARLAPQAVAGSHTFWVAGEVDEAAC